MPDFCTYLLDQGVITTEQFKSTKTAQKRAVPSLPTLALEKGMISGSQKQLIDSASKVKNEKLEKVAVNLRFLNEEQVAQLKIMQKSRYADAKTILAMKGFVKKLELETYYQSYIDKSAGDLSVLEDCFEEFKDNKHVIRFIQASMVMAFRMLNKKPYFVGLSQLNTINSDVNIAHTQSLYLERTSVEVGVIVSPYVSLELMNTIFGTYSDIDENIVVDSVGEYLSMIMGELTCDSFFSANRKKLFPPQFTHVNDLLNNDIQYSVIELAVDDFPLWLLYHEKYHDQAIKL